MANTLKDETGNSYETANGTWEVISFAGRSTSTNGSEWNCQCKKCQFVLTIRGSNLRRRRLPKCPNCCQKCGKTRQQTAFRGGKYICVACDRARVRGWKDGNEAFERRLGEWHSANSTKKAEYHKRRRVKIQQCPYLFLTDMLDPRRRLYKSLQVLTDTRARHKAKNPERFKVEVTPEFLHRLWDSQQGRCAITNMVMTHRFNSLKSVSIDRIDSDKGYVEGNIQLVCRWVNLAKGKFTNEEVKGVLDEFADSRTPSHLR